MLSKNVSGNRLKSFNYLSLLKSFSNYGRKNEEHIEGSFFYPRNGFGSIFDALYEIIGRKNILLEDPVINITLLQKDKYLVRTKSGKELISRKIICTLPPNIFMNIILVVFHLYSDSQLLEIRFLYYFKIETYFLT